MSKPKSFYDFHSDLLLHFPQLKSLDTLEEYVKVHGDVHTYQFISDATPLILEEGNEEQRLRLINLIEDYLDSGNEEVISLIQTEVLTEINSAHNSSDKLSVPQTLALFHDGCIESFEGDLNTLTLCIRCDYLAERIQSHFTTFYAVIQGIRKLQLNAWPTDKKGVIRKLTLPQDVFAASLDIMRVVESDNGKEWVSCLHLDQDHDITGGDLLIEADSIQILNQERNEIMIDELREIIREYWKQL